MSRTYEALRNGLDSDFQQVIQSLQEIFVQVATKTQGRATHTDGVAARGEARIIVPIGFPQTAALLPLAGSFLLLLLFRMDWGRPSGYETHESDFHSIIVSTRHRTWVVSLSVYFALLDVFVVLPWLICRLPS
jgi:hypothetical protein